PLGSFVIPNALLYFARLVIDNNSVLAGSLHSRTRINPIFPIRRGAKLATRKIAVLVLSHGPALEAQPLFLRHLFPTLVGKKLEAIGQRTSIRVATTWTLLRRTVGPQSLIEPHGLWSHGSALEAQPLFLLSLRHPHLSPSFVRLS